MGARPVAADPPGVFTLHKLGRLPSGLTCGLPEVGTTAWEVLLPHSGARSGQYPNLIAVDRKRAVRGP